MSATVVHKQLAAALKLAAPVASRSRHLPILSCVRLTVSDRVRVEATDGDLSVTTWADGVTLSEPFVAVVNANLLARFADRAHDDITLTPEDGDLVLSSAASTLRLRQMPVEDFPVIHHVDGQGVELPATLASILYAASRDGARPVLTGVGFADGWACATDSYRLAAVRLEGEFPSAIVPAHAIELAYKHGATTMVADSIRATFHSDIVKLSTRLVAGTFPNWRALVDPGPGVLEADRDELLDAIDGVLPLVKAQQPVVVEAGDGVMRLSARAADLGEATEEVAGTFAGDRVGLNPGYLADMLKACPEGQVRLALNGASKPAVWGSMDAGHVALLMPIRFS